MSIDLSRFGAVLQDVSESDTELRELPLDRVCGNPANFYPPIPAEELAELADSIAANGLLEPLLVVDAGGVYKVISGHNRLRAVKALHEQSGGRDHGTVLCRVLPAMDEATELTYMIEANRQRKKTSALLALEAERLTESYTRRKQAGEELPGRTRTRVAEALQVSETKLANLTAIKNGLKNTQLRIWWEDGTMPESAALEASRMDVDAQDGLRTWMMNHYPARPTLNNVRMFRVIWGGCLHECPEAGGTFCPNAEAIYREDFRDGAWHGARCCARCLRRDTCSACCDYVKQTEQAEAPEPEQQELPEPQTWPEAKTPDEDDHRDWFEQRKTEAETATADWQAKREAFGTRLRKARETTGLDRAAFAEKLGLYKATYSAWENGSLPGSGQFPDLARGLGVSTDYLYGLTDDPTPPGKNQPQPEGQMALAGWMPGSCHPAEPGDFVVLVDMDQPRYFRTFMTWDGTVWLMLPSRQSAALGPSWWMRLPPEPERGE